MASRVSHFKMACWSDLIIDDVESDSITCSQMRLKEIQVRFLHNLKPSQYTQSPFEVSWN